MPYYAVSCGRNTGIYTDWSLARQQTDGYSHAEFKKFLNKNDAVNYLHQKLSSKPYYAVSCGHERGLYREWSAAKKQVYRFSHGEVKKFFCKDDAMHFLRYRKVYDYESSWFCHEDNYSHDHFHCNADRLRALKRHNYWAVARGLVPSIYRSWDEARQQVDRFRSPIHKRFFCQDDALHFMRINGVKGWTCGSECDGSLGKFHCKKDSAQHEKNMIRNIRRKVIF
ncbi:hypothetical protein HCN44_009446 [Aphidius gifuensis]|uniref:Ribonuclease H n=1 Tax=Aphidius gifuensis TaxID=684658 RepID=A0A834Y6I5_APHGI|nr:uncharacterized protein LOC122860209 [Aphidius gifuensis]KAF7998048.1 hypothetical protein HCN44_009446 [Aphidius gifuensis]